MDETDTRYGTVAAEEHGHRLEFRRTWPVPADDVWTASTEPGRTARWIGRYDGERAPGATGRLTMSFGDDAPAEPLTVVECAELHRPGTPHRRPGDAGKTS